VNRSQKEAAVVELRKGLAESAATFLINYRGADVAALQNLRGKLREKDARFKISKARLMKIAASEINGGASLNGLLKDQIGLVFANGSDVSAVAKSIVDFAKEHDSVDIVSGFYESSVMTQDQVKFFASLPPREVLLAQLAGTLNAPLSNFVSVLHALIARLLYVLKRIEEKKGS